MIKTVHTIIRFELAFRSILYLESVLTSPLEDPPQEETPPFPPYRAATGRTPPFPSRAKTSSKSISYSHRNGSDTPVDTSQQSILLLTHLARCTFLNEPPPAWLLVSLFGLFNWRGHLDLGLHGISTVGIDYAVRSGWGSSTSAPHLTPQMLADSCPKGPESIATLGLPETQLMTTFTGATLQATNLPSIQPWPKPVPNPHSTSHPALYSFPPYCQWVIVHWVL